jgi:hypothetical protein
MEFLLSVWHSVQESFYLVENVAFEQKWRISLLAPECLGHTGLLTSPIFRSRLGYPPKAGHLPAPNIFLEYIEDSGTERFEPSPLATFDLYAVALGLFILSHCVPILNNIVFKSLGVC